MASAELEGAQGKEGAENADDPEANDHLRFLPAELLEMMVQRSAAEDAVLLRIRTAVPLESVFEDAALQDHGHHLGDEHEADEGQHELGLEQNSDAAECAAQRKRPGVAH